MAKRVKIKDLEHVITTRQRLFCYELASDPKKDITKAAKRAGFSEKAAFTIGSRLLKAPQYINVQRFYESLLQNTIKALKIDIKKVLRNIDKVSETCLGQVETKDKNGNIVKSKFDASGALGANKLLGQYLKMFTDDERETTVNVTVMPQITIGGKKWEPKIGKQKKKKE